MLSEKDSRKIPSQFRSTRRYAEAWRRLRGGLLFTVLTGALAASVVACQLTTNDLGDRPMPGYPHVYRPELRPGSSAREILSPKKFPKLVIEIQSMPGMNPSQEALNHFETFLERVLGRTERQIEIVLDHPIPSPKKAAYTLLDVRGIEARHRRIQSRKDTIAAYVLFVDAPSSDDRGSRKLLGQAHQNTSIVIYASALREVAESGSVPLWVAEATILEHEFGHLLGLTNMATAAQTPHQDPMHRGHCIHPTCLMYYANESSEALSLLGGNVPELDSGCLQDLNAAISR